jgi:hypothetical protein
MTTMTQRPLIVVCVVLAIQAISGCTLIQKTTQLPVQAIRSLPFLHDSSRVYDPVSLQETLLRFADNYIISTIISVDSLKQDGKPLERDFIVLAKIRLTSDIVSLVTGSNSLNNLISTLIYAKSLRKSIDDYWAPVHFGDSAQVMRNALDDRIQELEKYASGILTPQQIIELESVIMEWQKSHPTTSTSAGELANISIVSQVLKAGNQTRKEEDSKSVFSLLDLDPLASLDPATQELAETRLFGERTLFLTQRLPQLLEWQMELLTLRTTHIPEVSSLVDSAAGISKASERFSLTVQDLPSIIHKEQDAFMSRLKEQQAGLDTLARDTEKTFAEGTRMAEATREVIVTYKNLLNLINEQSSKDPNDKPFDITEWGTTADRVERMSSSLNTLLESLVIKGESPQFQHLEISTTETAQKIIDYALWRGLLFLMAFVVFSAITLVTSLVVYKRLTTIRSDN